MTDEVILSAEGCWGAAADKSAQHQADGQLPQLLVVAAALVDVDNRILLAQRPAG